MGVVLNDKPKLLIRMILFSLKATFFYELKCGSCNEIRLILVVIFQACILTDS